MVHIIKKLFVVSFFLLCYPLVTLPYATKETPPMTPVTQQHGFNLGVQIGNTWQDWEHFTRSSTPGFIWTNGTTHYNWSVNGGYQFTNYVAVEGGFLHAFTVATPMGGIRAWTTYAAARLMTPLYDSTGIETIFEVGLAYNHYTKGNDLISYYFSPIFSAGINLDITSAIKIDFQYIYLLGYQSKIDPYHQFTTPNSNIANIGIEYLFST